MRILGIETSCDETAAAIIEVHSSRFTVHSNVIASQIKIHAKTGGVVPEVAAREHIRKIIPVLERALSAPPLRGGCRLLVAGPKIDAIAVTAGPGLATSLSVGIEVARTLAWLWKKPVVAVNHLAGHIYANWLNPHLTPHQNEFGAGQVSPLERGRKRGLKFSPYGGSPEGRQFPILCLIVSGGHTELVLMKKHLDFKVIGSTRDDAAGECFDKVAKMLGLRYPGGPETARIAKQFTVHSSQFTVNFPRPMIDSPDYDFSFSGLKTAVLYYLKSTNQPINKLTLPALCHEFQQAVVDVLVSKTIRAAKEYKVKTILLGGGVAANSKLREGQKCAIAHFCPDVIFNAPPIQYTTDNAAMIAVAGYFMAREKKFIPWQKLDVDPNWEIGKKLAPPCKHVLLQN